MSWPVVQKMMSGDGNIPAKNREKRVEKTEQENFWKGSFGDEYSGRNTGSNWVASNLAFFSRVLPRGEQVGSILELGSNIGLNLMALRALLPETRLSAVEINERAALELRRNIADVDLHQMSLLDFDPNGDKWDLVFTKGVLIHVNPEKLPEVYGLMYESSSRFILVAEYYNPTPVEVSYRGHAGKLFKRDFAGEMMEQFPSLKLIDYGFVYHGDRNFPQDDVNWFLMEKNE